MRMSRVGPRVPFLYTLLGPFEAHNFFNIFFFICALLLLFFSLFIVVIASVKFYFTVLLYPVKL